MNDSRCARASNGSWSTKDTAGVPATVFRAAFQRNWRTQRPSSAARRDPTGAMKCLASRSTTAPAPTNGAKSSLRPESSRSRIACLASASTTSSSAIAHPARSSRSRTTIRDLATLQDRANAQDRVPTRTGSGAITSITRERTRRDAPDARLCHPLHRPLVRITTGTNTMILPAGMCPDAPGDPRRRITGGNGTRSSTRYSAIHPEGPDDPSDPSDPSDPDLTDQLPYPRRAPCGRPGSTITLHPARVIHLL